MKVRDKVRVRKDLKIGTGRMGAFAVRGMQKYAGQVLTIKYIDSDYTFTVKENDWWWSPEMLEPVKEDKLIFNGNATILFKDGKKYVTKCDEDDIYDREKGLLIVLAKANGYTYNDIQEILNNATIKSKPNTDNSQVLIAQLVKEIEKLKQEKHDWEWYSQDLEREVEELKC